MLEPTREVIGRSRKISWSYNITVYGNEIFYQPYSYDKIAFNDKTNLLMEHFIDMAVQGYGWI